MASVKHEEVAELEASELEAAAALAAFGEENADDAAGLHNQAALDEDGARYTLEELATVTPEYLCDALCQKQLALPLRMFGPEKGSRNVPQFLHTYVNYQDEVRYLGFLYLRYEEQAGGKTRLTVTNSPLATKAYPMHRIIGWTLLEPGNIAIMFLNPPGPALPGSAGPSPGDARGMASAPGPAAAAPQVKREKSQPRETSSGPAAGGGASISGRTGGTSAGGAGAGAGRAGTSGGGGAGVSHTVGDTLASRIVLLPVDEPELAGQLMSIPSDVSSNAVLSSNNVSIPLSCFGANPEERRMPEYVQIYANVSGQWALDLGSYKVRVSALGGNTGVGSGPLRMKLSVGGSGTLYKKFPEPSHITGWSRITDTAMLMFVSLPAGRPLPTDLAEALAGCCASDEARAAAERMRVQAHAYAGSSAKQAADEEEAAAAAAAAAATAAISASRQGQTAGAGSSRAKAKSQAKVSSAGGGAGGWSTALKPGQPTSQATPATVAAAAAAGAGAGAGPGSGAGPSRKKAAAAVQEPQPASKRARTSGGQQQQQQQQAAAAASAPPSSLSAEAAATSGRDAADATGSGSGGAAAITAPTARERPAAAADGPSTIPRVVLPQLPDWDNMAGLVPPHLLAKQFLAVMSALSTPMEVKLSLMARVRNPLAAHDMTTAYVFLQDACAAQDAAAAAAIVATMSRPEPSTAPQQQQ